ncbi:hypothetical protein WA026_011274 [Henosepilachna vigintioctopunctata]|uniref:Uncharacterized protein n=1 Tax=Henosepilachna vigintioctopunctata TaxID=420089 RepID=A0AAW1U0T8_9CUCU
MNKTNDTVLNLESKHENSSKTANNVSWANVQQESGLLTKGMMLLLIVSLFFIMFVAYKTYRRKSRYARIKKYGVRLTRGNVEMRPLPLDNDDEDETIFDLKNIPT